MTVIMFSSSYVLISEAQREERYISYFHKPIVQRWATPSSSWRRWRCRWRRWRPRRQRPAGVFPLQSAAPNLRFGVFVFVRRSFQRTTRDLFYRRFLGQDEGGGAKIDGNGATRAKRVGPTRPQYLATWATPVWSSDLRLFASFAHRSSCFQILTPVNFQVISLTFGSLKH